MPPTIKPTSTTPRLLRVSEAARLLSCSERQVWRLLKHGQLTAVKIGNMTRIPEQSLETLIRTS